MPRPKIDDATMAKRREDAKFLTDAMATLGQMWGLERPLTNSEMARALKLGGPKGIWPGSHISKLVHCESTLTGPIEVAIGMMLDGAVPRSIASVVKPGYPRKAA